MNLIFNINKPITEVFEYLTDMQKFASVHPVISKIDKLSENKYLVHETLKLGFIPISFTYPVTIEHNFGNKTIRICATVMRFTKIEMNYLLTAEDGGTAVMEDISIHSPLPIVGLIGNIFGKQHTELFKNINRA